MLDAIPQELLLAAGAVPGLTKVQLRGCQQAITTSARTVWNGQSLYAQLTAAVAFEVISGSANDAAAGTGARTVSLDLVDGNYVQTTVTATLNGTNAVAITGTFLACNAIRVLTTGSGLTNAGTITVRTVSGSTVKRAIQQPAGLFGANGLDADFVYTIPAGYVGILRSFDVSGTGVTGDFTATIQSRDSLGTLSDRAATKSSLYVTAFNAAICRMDLGAGLYLPEKTEVELRAFASAGAGFIVAQADLYLLKKTVSSFIPAS